MTTLEARCLDAFPDWLRSLADDARALASVLEGEGAAVAQRRSAAALNYLFKSLDLIPDGLEDLGFIDDAFVRARCGRRRQARGREPSSPRIRQARSPASPAMPS